MWMGVHGPQCLVVILQEPVRSLSSLLQTAQGGASGAGFCLKPHDGGRAEHTELLGTVRRDEEQPVTWLPWLAGEGRHATARSALHPAPKEKLEALQAGSPYYQHSGPLSSKEVCSLPSLWGNLGAGKLASLGRAGLLPTRAQERMGAST